VCISLVCGPRRQRRLCRQKLTLDAGGLWPECSGHVKSHTKHLPCDHSTSVKPSGRLPSFRDRHDGSSLAGISAAVSARVMRSLTALCPCVANDDRQTAGMTEHEHHIGRRFLRRRTDGERKLAHQDVALSRCGMTNCRGAFQLPSSSSSCKGHKNSQGLQVKVILGKITTSKITYVKISENTS